MPSPSFFQIPGNVKNQLIPFVINPNSKINQKASSSQDLIGASPQVFSYRLNTSTKTEGGTARLRFYPSSLDDVVIEDDISLKLLYARDNLYTPGVRCITMSDIINSIPGVSIREFLPDTRLDQCINLFVDMMKNMTKLFSGEKDSSQSQDNKQQKVGTNDEAAWYEKLMAAAWYTMKYMVGATNPDFYDDLSFGTNVSNLPFSSYKKEVYQNNTEWPGSFVMAFPYTLYYRLQSCVTTNIYEIPAQSSNKALLNSGGGMAGWTDGGGDDFMSAGGFRMSGILGKIPVIGSIANMMLGNIGINYMPWWNAESGAKTKEPQIELKFDLYNDSYDAAMMNFIFVNTLVPHNRWVQYNMFQHSSSLYDVKIEGVNRLFACAGDFNVTYEGILRDPPKKWLENIVKTHSNNCMDKDTFLQNLLNNRIIKVPDVYRVTMNFQSLLPANFNNYIFSFAQNAGHIETYTGKAYQESAVAEVLPKAMAKYAERVKHVWDAADSSVEDTIAKKEKEEQAKQQAQNAQS